MKFLSSGLRAQADVSNPDVWAPLSGYSSYSFATKAGQSISVHNAMKVSAFSAGVRFISQIMGMVPLHMYRRVDERAKEKVPEHPLHYLLHSQPNPYMTALQWKQCMTANAILRGNGYSYIDWDGNMIRKLQPLSSDAMRVDYKDSGEPVYLYYENTDKEKRFSFDEIFHLPGFGDGFVGVSVVELAKETLGLALSLEEHAARYFSNGAELGGVLEAPQGLEIDSDAINRVVSSFNRKYSSVEKHHLWALLENGIQAKRLGMTNVESQFLEARKFIILECARWLGLPPHVLGELERAIKSNIEQQARELVMFHLLPWFVKWEQTIKRDLILYPERYFAEFKVDMLLRGDTATRWQAYKVGIEHGVYSPDDVRSKENENPREDGRGGRYLQALNYTSFPGDGDGELEEIDGDNEEARYFPPPMQALQQQPVVLVLSEGQQVRALQPGSAMRGTPVPKKGNSQLMEEKARAIAEQEIERLVRKEITAMERWAPRYTEGDKKDWERWVREWYRKHAMSIMESLRIERKAAEDYCEANITEILEKGHEVTGTWLPGKKERLISVVFEEKENEV